VGIATAFLGPFPSRGGRPGRASCSKPGPSVVFEHPQNPAEVPLIKNAVNEKAIQDRERGEPDGVDISLIRWMLSLSPKERLLVLQSNARSIARLRALRARS
jgi:hypothetical protein